MQNAKLKTQNHNLKLKTKNSVAKWHLSFDFGALRFEFARGFTLLEVTVALAVITAAVVGPVYLITKGIFSSSFSKNKLIASNLAQEGIEAVRAVRENNVVCGYLNQDSSRNWLTGSNGVGTMGSQQKVDASQNDTIQCGTGGIYTLTNPQIRDNCSSATLKLDANNHYGYTGSTETGFTRCVDVVQPGSGEGSIPASSIADVTSTVTWTEKNISRNVIIKERLYDWR